MAEPRGILIVDLDGTLLRSDMLFESFWSALGADWRSPFLAAHALMRGRACLKAYLAGAARIDCTTLPYDPEVIAYIERWRAEGGQTALVTATDRRLAVEIAGHLGLFDEVHGSDGGDPESPGQSGHQPSGNGHSGHGGADHQQADHGLADLEPSDPEPDAPRNLKGAVKAAFLEERFGAGGFAYMGDAAADLPVWQVAGRAITVNASAALRRRVEALGGQASEGEPPREKAPGEQTPGQKTSGHKISGAQALDEQTSGEQAPGGKTPRDIEHLETVRPDPRAWLQALRPHQWLKNLLVFLPMLAAHRLDGGTMLAAILGFAVFSLVASGVYVLNDLLDLGADRAHPRKRQRPFASGAIPIGHGVWMAGGLILTGFALALALGTGVALLLLAYFALTTAYSLWLKRQTVIDICVLAGLYTLRIVAGGLATGITLSVWLLAFSIFFFLALAAVKRQAELVDGAARGSLAAAGRGYRIEDLPIIATIAIGAGYVSVLVMALYLNSPAVLQLYPLPAALWGICCVLLYWLTRMVMLAHRGRMHDDPVVYAVTDRVSWLCGAIILASALAGTFLERFPG